MRVFRAALCIALTAFAAIGASSQAMAARVGLVPGYTVRGHQENAARLTEAVDAELRDRGHTIVDASVGAQTAVYPGVARLAAAGKRAGVNRVVFVRIQNVGKPVNPQNEREYRAVCLLWVIDVPTKKQIFFRQIEQPFSSTEGRAAAAVMPEAAASEAAATLVGHAAKHLPK